MKARPEPAPLTPEDLKIWRRVCIYRFHIPASLRGRTACAEKAAQRADRRDAELMLRLTELSCRIRRASRYQGMAAVHTLIRVDPDHFGWWGFAC